MIIMAKSNTRYKIPHRRRLEKTTDYKTRFKLVSGGKTRAVIRKSLENISVQFVQFDKTGDRTVASAESQELKKLGWSFGRGNLPAAYLTGLLAGKLAKSKGVNEAVLDIGLQTSTKGSRLYAALKGVIDAGVNVPHSNDVLPDEKRIGGHHIQGKQGTVTHFEDVKKKIMSK